MQEKRFVWLSDLTESNKLTRSVHITMKFPGLFSLCFIAFSLEVSFKEQIRC